MDYLLKHLSNIEVGILLFIALFNPPLGKFFAIVTVLAFELAKAVRAVECTIKKDLTGKVAIITGGNTGIGKQTALELAKQGCQVVIGARDIKKNIATIEQIRKITNNQNIFQISLDLGSRQSIDRFSDEVHSQFKQIHYLINNAGVMMVPQKRTTTDGFEMQIGINHFGHFYFTYKLWDLLKQVSDVRIVNLSSMAHKGMGLSSPSIQFDNINFEKGDYSGQTSYSRSKLANVLFTQELAQRLSKSHPNARCVSVHPGVVKTQLSRYMMQGKQWLTPVYNFIGTVFMKSPRQGAQTTLFTTLADSNDIVNGAYYSDSAVGKKNPFAQNPQNQKSLWKKSQELLKISFNAN